MIYTLTLNPSLDYTMEFARLQPGAMNRAKKTGITVGGKGINVSAVLSELKVPNTILGFIAGFTGDRIEEILKINKANTDFVKLPSGTSRINVKVLAGESTELNAPGPVIDKNSLKLLKDKLTGITSDDVLVIAGAIPASLPEFTYRTLLDDIKARNITTVIDTSGEALLSTLETAPFLIKPNRQELEALFSTRIASHTEVDKYAHELQKLGARNVLVSLDREGAVLCCEDGNVLYRPAPEGEINNTIGAGDSMVAGFLWGWLETGSYEDALKCGIAAGTACAFSNDLPMGDDIRSLRRLL